MAVFIVNLTPHIRGWPPLARDETIKKSFENWNLLTKRCL